MSALRLPGPARRAWLRAAAALAAWPGLAAAATPDPADPVRRGRPWQWPRDHGVHPGARVEWWYLSGRLQAAGGTTPAAGGRVFGYQLTFFASRTGLEASASRRLTASHVLFAHGALTDLSARRHLHAQRTARWGGGGPVGGASASAADTGLHLAGWRLLRDGGTGASTYRAKWASEDTGAAFACDLRLRATQPLLLQGDGGWSAKGGHAASHYLSEPQLRAEGRLSLGGDALDVSGTGWLDHEWSDTLLPPQAVGWDWIGINLDDGSALMAFRLRAADGRVLGAGGSWRAPGQPSRSFAAEEVRFEARRWWTSARTAARYPVQWEVSTPAGRFLVEALLDAQELDGGRSTGTVYWEGLSALRDAAGRTLGHGYLEMTGYAGALKL